MSVVHINNKTLGYQPIWQSNMLCDFVVEDHVDIWRININSSLINLNRFYSILNASEISRANRYLRKQDREKFIISRGALRFILANYLKLLPQSILFLPGLNNKPYVAGSIEFNLSDSEDWVIVGVGKSPLGLDVEYIKPAFEYDIIIDNYFNETERTFIKSSESLKRFFLLWTRKEALLKATGIGLMDDLLMISSVDGKHTIEGKLLATTENWFLNSFEVANDHIATIALNNFNTNFSFWNFGK